MMVQSFRQYRSLISRLLGCLKQIQRLISMSPEPGLQHVTGDGGARDQAANGHDPHLR